MFPASPGPDAIVLWGVVVSWYGILIALATVLGVLAIRILAQKANKNVTQITDIIFWVVIVGFIGARLYHIWNEWWFYKDHLFEVWRIWDGGLAIHGGMLFGGVTLLLLARKKKIHFFILTDLIVPGLILAQAIGRWGNYFNEELFGKPFDGFLRLAVSFQSRPVEFISHTTFYPLFLYEFLLNGLLFGLLVWMCKKTKVGTGMFTAMYLFGYGVIRFSLDFLRFDQFGFGPLTMAQWVSIGMVAIALFILYRTKNNNLKIESI